MAAEPSTGTDVNPPKCYHDEADTRMLLCLTDLGFERLVSSSRDTDVLVLLVHFASDLTKEIWFQTGTAKKGSFVAVHDVDLDPVLRHNLPGFHAIPSCDTVSQFCGIGKTTA